MIKNIKYLLFLVTFSFSQELFDYSGEVQIIDSPFQRNCPDPVDSCLYVCSEGNQNPCHPESIYSISIDTTEGSENSVGSRFRIYFPWEYEGLNANKFRVTASWPALSPTAVFAWGDYAYFDVIGNGALPGTVQGSIWYGSDCQDSDGNIGSDDCIELIGRFCFAPGDTLDWPEYMDQSIANDMCDACWVSFPAWSSYDEYPYSDSLLSPGYCEMFDHCHIDPPDSVSCGIGFLDGEDTTTVSILNSNFPNKVNLVNMYPNPFNPTVNISYTVFKESDVQIQIYNLKGLLIKNIYNLKGSIGNHLVTWNAVNKPSGLYFIKILIDKDVQTRKVLFLK